MKPPMFGKNFKINIFFTKQILTKRNFRGVQVERVEVKDVRLPVNMQRAMATEAEATRFQLFAWFFKLNFN